MSRQYPSVLQRSTRSRSPIGRLSINQHQQSSPFRSTGKQNSLKRLQASDIDAFIEKLQCNRQALCTCFDIFQLLFQNGVPQRCITHNNFVTLYCENEQKLLCVNCIYDQSTHQQHKVDPIKRCFDKIHKDNRDNEKKLKQIVQIIANTHERVVNFVSESKLGLQKTLFDLNNEYSSIIKILQEKYQIIRQSVIDRYTKIGNKYRQLQHQLAWLTKTYIQREANLPKSQQQSAEIFEHVLLNTLLDPQKIDLKIIDAFNNEEIRNQQLSQIIKIKSFIQNLHQQKGKKMGFF